MDKDSVIRELLSMAIKDTKLKEALELVRQRKITVWKGAKLAGISYRELLEELRARNTPFPLSEEELRNEIEKIDIIHLAKVGFINILNEPYSFR